MFAATGSTRIAAVCAPCSASAASSAARSLYGTTIVSATVPGVTPAEPGRPERGDTAARLHEQRVEMAVIAARELHDLVAPGRAARQAHRGHRRLGTRRHEPCLLHRRHARADRFDELDLAGRRRAVRSPVGRGAAARLRRPSDTRDRGSTRPTTARSRGIRDRRCRRCDCRSARATKNGSPPTEPNARTGELTPPGMRGLRAREPVGLDSLTSTRSTGRLGELAREVREDHVGARALHRERGARPRPRRRRSNRVGPPALTIAYSPLTWYAATGTSNAARTSAMTSRYASAGLIITMSAPSATSSATSTSASRPLRGIHLVAAPIAELRRALRRVAERSVQRRRVLGRVGEDRRGLVTRTRRARRGSRRPDRPSFRSARSRRRRLRPARSRSRRSARASRRCRPRASWRRQTAVTVVGVLVEAVVGHQHERVADLVA